MADERIPITHAHLGTGPQDCCKDSAHVDLNEAKFGLILTNDDKVILRISMPPSDALEFLRAGVEQVLDAIKSAVEGKPLDPKFN